MAQFDESKVINGLHPEKAEVGKKYWRSDNLQSLKKYVETNDTYQARSLQSIDNTSNYPFEFDVDWYQFLYPYEEPPKQRMTNRQLNEWLAKGNGVYTYKQLMSIYSDFAYNKSEEYDLVDGDITIRPWDSEEWIEPTVDIYERDCKGGK